MPSIPPQLLFNLLLQTLYSVFTYTVLVQGEDAVCWRCSLCFEGDGQRYFGEVLAYDSKRSSHLVLYDDGEHEWVQLHKEDAQWLHRLPRGSTTAVGLPHGKQRP